MSVLSPTLWAMITSTKFNWERHFPIQMEIFRISSKGLLITVHFWHHLANIVIIIIIIIIVIIIGIYYLQYNAVNAKWTVDGSCPWSQKWVYATGWQKEEDGKTLVCDKGDGGITRVFFRDLHLTFNFFLLFYKRFFKGVWSLVGGYFKQKYCHGCHTRFAIIFPFPPCRVSLLKTCRWHYSHPYAKQISCSVLWKQL